MPRTLAEISLEVGLLLQPLLQEAFELGRAEGRTEAAADLRARLAGVLESDLTARDETRLSKSERPDRSIIIEPPAHERATPGTVKPAIEALLRSAADGLSAQQIADRAMIKYNSVRGTLYILKNEGKAERRGDRWFPTLQSHEAPDGKSVRDTSEASDHQPGAQGGEARPGGGT